MEQRLSFVTLAVADLPAARRFYIDGLGWSADYDAEQIVMIKVGSQLMLSLWQREAFEAEVGPLGPPGPAPITLAHNVATEAEVDEVMAAAQAAGARLLHPATRRDWGGYTGYVADPDGYVWEIAHNPGPTGQSIA